MSFVIRIEVWALSEVWLDDYKTHKMLIIIVVIVGQVKYDHDQSRKKKKRNYDNYNAYNN